MLSAGGGSVVVTGAFGRGAALGGGFAGELPGEAEVGTSPSPAEPPPGDIGASHVVRRDNRSHSRSLPASLLSVLILPLFTVVDLGLRARDEPEMRMTSIAGRSGITRHEVTLRGSPPPWFVRPGAALGRPHCDHAGHRQRIEFGPGQGSRRERSDADPAAASHTGDRTPRETEGRPPTVHHAHRAMAADHWRADRAAEDRCDSGYPVSLSRQPGETGQEQSWTRSSRLSAQQLRTVARGTS